MVKTFTQLWDEGRQKAKVHSFIDRLYRAK